MNRRRSTISPHFFKRSFPIQFPAQLASLTLPSHLNKKAQTSLNRRLLRIEVATKTPYNRIK